MGRKDVPENTGCGHPAESGVHTVFPRLRRNQIAGPAEDLPVSVTSDHLRLAHSQLSGKE